MLTLAVFSLILAIVMIAITIALFLRLRANEVELERAYRRMARLDEFADAFTDVETEEAARTWPAADYVEELQDHEIIELVEKEPESEYTMSVPGARETGRFDGLGAQFDSEAMFDDDFAPPGMAVGAKSAGQQRAARQRHKTPVGSPRNNTPRSMESIVAVGSIQLRTDEISRSD